ncbi:hypothetical protein [Bremerella volcania]|uniref:hypothetical protein n=1 Tax=Bremerella volcania TaxID=2527984 RepID=UPI0011A7FBEF|nr:hypothetical protein [Bremerella volcania]
MPLFIQLPTGIAAAVYAVGSIAAALLWKPLSILSLVVIFLLPGIAAAMVGLNAMLRLRPHGPLLAIYLGIIPLVATLFIGGPVTILAWLLST